MRIRCLGKRAKFHETCFKRSKQGWGQPLSVSGLKINHGVMGTDVTVGCRKSTLPDCQGLSSEARTLASMCPMTEGLATTSRRKGLILSLQCQAGRKGCMVEFGANWSSNKPLLRV